MKSSLDEDRTIWEVIRDDMLLAILPDVLQVLGRSRKLAGVEARRAWRQEGGSR